MSARPLHMTNLNLVPVLRILLREANVTRAAGHLGVTQSAVSGALAQLRLLLGDPLLVRAGGAMRLTPRAKSLVDRLEQLCGGLEELIQNEVFDPATTERSFVVATTDYEGLLIAPALVQTLSQTAPKASVRLIEPTDRLAERMASGEIDLCFLKWPNDAGDVRSLRLTSDRIVGLVRKDHPLAGVAAPTEAEIEVYPHVGWHPGPDMRPGVDYSLSPEHPVRFQLVTQQFLAGPLVVSQTDAVTQVPRALALWLSRLYAVHVFDLPYPTLALGSSMVWSAVYDADPGHRWFRERLQTAVHLSFPEETRI